MWTKKAVKDMTSNEVDDEIKRLAEHYNISVEKDGGATATMSAPEPAATKEPKKQQLAEKPKEAQKPAATPKKKAKPAAKKKGAGDDYVDRLPGGATRGAQASGRRKLSGKKEDAEPAKAPGTKSLRKGDYRTLGIAAHGEYLKRRREELEAKRAASADKKSKPAYEPVRNTAVKELIALREKKKH